jgi:hypothetical protein
MKNKSIYGTSRQREVTVTWTPAHEKAYQRISNERQKLRIESNKKALAIGFIAMALYVALAVAVWRWYFDSWSANPLLAVLVAIIILYQTDFKREAMTQVALARFAYIFPVLMARRSLTHTESEMTRNKVCEEAPYVLESDIWKDVFDEPDEEINALPNFDIQVHTYVEDRP